MKTLLERHFDYLQKEHKPMGWLEGVLRLVAAILFGWAILAFSVGFLEAWPGLCCVGE